MSASKGSNDLFSAQAESALSKRAPLAARLRPRRLDDVVGQEQLIGPDAPLRVLLASDRLTSVILWGPPGTGKTTLARLIARETSQAFEALSAVTAGVKDVRAIAEAARARLGERGHGTILFLDEVHRFNRSQQDALLPHVEEGLLVLVGATTENPYFSLTAPLLSRSSLLRLEPLSHDDLRTLVKRALEDSERGLGASGLVVADDALEHLVGRAEGDGRNVLTSLDVAAGLALEAERSEILLADAEAALATRALRYGDDEHYDVLSAFIKSIRGSDVDAGLYWLARMVEAGEDPRLIARRLVILASEDVGMADPTALVVADAAARAVEFVGLPEAQLNLAQAVVHLARAPKSNAVTVALGAARADIADTASSGVPDHLRDSHYKGAGALGHGDGYVYPHDHPDGRVEQRYRPPEVDGHRYFRPTGRGQDVIDEDAIDTGTDERPHGTGDTRESAEGERGTDDGSR